MGGELESTGGSAQAQGSPFRQRRGSAHTFQSSLYPIHGQGSPEEESYLSDMFRGEREVGEDSEAPKITPVEVPSERDALLPRNAVGRGYGGEQDGDVDVEGGVRRRGTRKIQRVLARPVEWGKEFVHQVKNDKKITKKALWKHGVVEPVSYLPAVTLGLLLNVLDGLSYGMSPPKHFLYQTLIARYRHDFVSARPGNLLGPRPGWSLHLLRFVYRLTAGVFAGRKCLQGRHRL